MEVSRRDAFDERVEAAAEAAARNLCGLESARAQKFSIRESLSLIVRDDTDAQPLVAQPLREAAMAVVLPAPRNPPMRMRWGLGTRSGA